MGLLDRLFGTTAVQAAASGTSLDVVQPARLNLGDPYEPFDGYRYGSSGIAIADPGVPLSMLQKNDVEAVWQSQPDLRKVVDFIARNIATIPLNVYDRRSDTDRERVRDHPLARTLSRPSRQSAPFQFWRSVITDGLLYDKWAALRVDFGDRVELVQIPSWRLRLDVNALRLVTGAWMWVGDGPAQDGDVNGYRPLDMTNLLFDHGYAPRSAGLSPVETLKDTLAERAAAVEQRREFFANGARASMYVSRGAEAPQWGDPQRSRFVAALRGVFGRGGSNPGGTLLLEDGMTLNAVPRYTSHETFDLDGRKLTAEEVAGFFHIPPEALGMREGTYSNLRQITQSLYRDALGPYISALEGVLNAQLVPMFAGTDSFYVEANIETKLRGSFEEQAKVKQSATGTPWLTINEARALENRPPVEGGDEIAKPLNLRFGSSTTTPGDTSQPAAAPGTSSGAPAAKARAVLVKARPPQSVVDEAVEVLTRFFGRQGTSVASAAERGGDLWDTDRWNRELADELMAVNVLVATSSGRQALDALGFDPDDWDSERTTAWLRKNADGVAEGVNDTTRQQVEDGLAEDAEGGRAAVVGAVFAGVVAGRAQGLGESQVSAISGFGTSEAVNQKGIEAQKTWRVRSTDPRPSHAALNGTTIGMGETFANGARWPGDSLATPDERAGCTCDIEVSVAGQ